MKLVITTVFLVPTYIKSSQYMENYESQTASNLYEWCSVNAIVDGFNSYTAATWNARL